jgi:hypothetical protein
LLDAGTRGIIFSYVGPGYWLFIGQVCKDFKKSYLKVAPQREDWYDEHCIENCTICTNKHTLSRAVFASEGCLRLAVVCGLMLYDEDAWRLRRPAGFYSDLQLYD